MPVDYDRGHALARAVATAITAETTLAATARRVPLSPRDRITETTISVICVEEEGDPEADRAGGNRRFVVDVAVQKSVKSNAEAELEAPAQSAARIANLWQTDDDGEPGPLFAAEMSGCRFVGLTWAPRIRPDLLFKFSLFTSIISLEYEALQ